MAISNENMNKVINQEVGGQRAADYLADKLVELERKNVDIQKMDTLLRGYKQLNNTNKNVIDAQRVALKEYEYENLKKAN